MARKNRSAEHLKVDAKVADPSLPELESMEFFLALKEVAVTLHYPPDHPNETWKGKARKCILRELTGPLRTAYLRDIGSKTDKTDDGKVEIREYNGLYTALLTRSLWDRESGNALTSPEIDGFPSSVEMALFKRAQDISGLGAAAKKEATKNS